MFVLTQISVALFITTLVNIFTTIVSWRRSSTKGDWYFTWGMMGVTLWTLAAGFDYAAIPIPVKVFFAGCEYIGYNSALALFAMFALSYAGYDDWLEKLWVKAIFFIIPISNIILAWTNDLHGLLWRGFTHNESANNVVIFEHGPGFVWVTITGYLMIFAILISLWQASRIGSELSRRQARLLFVASLIPVIGNLIYLLEIPEIRGIDWSSITFSISGLCFLMALYSARLLDLVPIAGNTIIEQMEDCILVLDERNRLVDFNLAAQEIFGINQDQIGNPINVVMSPWPDIVNLASSQPGNSSQVTISNGANPIVFDTHMTHLEDNRGNLYSQLIVFRDITKYYQTEQVLAERVKELKCIYELSLLVERKGVSLDDILQESVRLIAEAMQYPDIACANLLVGDRSYTTENYQETDCKISHPVSIDGRGIGRLEIAYLEQPKCEDVFPFLEEEKNLLHIMTERMSNIIRNHKAEEALLESEKLIRLRLMLWEYSTNHPLENLMQKALDEIGELTGSPIGFYHFVEEDQKTLSLQAWSTRTLKEYCTAEGRGLHYDIDKAGVWVDAFHQAKPVIHNEYATLPDRKGLPEGHAELIRELVVPVIRNGRVVSILGVGNKVTHYDDSDIALVSMIADIVWTIVDRKRTDEQIQLLNTQLEKLAMTDELTELLNRRSFFSSGEDEFERFLRYQNPFSVLILDIDSFKNINDTFGHDAGDRALEGFANTLRESIRSSDILARLGGEEFGIILPNTGKVDAKVTAEKLRLAVEQQRLVVAETQEVSLTVSIGVSTVDKRINNFDALLKEADTALYQAKNRGRNIIVSSEDK